MKAVVKATGEQIEVYPSFFNGEVVSYRHVNEAATRVYKPEELDVDKEAFEHERLAMQYIDHEEVVNKDSWTNNFDGKNKIEWLEVNWKEVEIHAAYHALLACIIAGKNDAAKSAVYYAKQLVEELKKCD